MKKVNKFVLNEIDEGCIIPKNELKKIVGGFDNYDGVCYKCYYSGDIPIDQIDSSLWGMWLYCNMPLDDIKIQMLESLDSNYQGRIHAVCELHSYTPPPGDEYVPGG